MARHRLPIYYATTLSIWMRLPGHYMTHDQTHVANFRIIALVVGMLLFSSVASAMAATPGPKPPSATVTALDVSFTPGSASPVPQPWFDSGHRVVADIAWENLTEGTRMAVTRLLRMAPDGADLPGGIPLNSSSETNRALFLKASTWPDRVRDADDPERRQQYHRGKWHYVNHFWASTPNGPLTLADRESEPENATNKLIEFIGTVADSSLSPDERALHLAWIIHLVGDLHQPLHASSRVTPDEPAGDRGGGLFALHPDDDLGNLHVYWDGILDLSYPRQEKEDDLAYTQRLKKLVTGRSYSPSQPARLRTTRMDSTQVTQWVNESLEIAQLSVYIPVLSPGESPPPIYQRHALRIAKVQLQTAGMRLAILLNDLFEPRP